MNNLNLNFPPEKTTERTYLTVYIAGFPEYFDLDNSLITSYICLRWEKVTGRIDLAISGELIAGKNSCKCVFGEYSTILVSRGLWCSIFGVCLLFVWCIFHYTCELWSLVYVWCLFGVYATICVSQLIVRGL